MKSVTSPRPPIEFVTGPHPKVTIFLLHGLGSSGEAFLPLARSLDFTGVGDIRMVLPNAPIQAVSWAGGQYIPAWYDLRHSDFSRQEDETGLRNAMGYYESLIHREISRGIKAERIVIGGFSQGSALSLMTGIRFGHRLAGIFGMSGYLPLASASSTEQHDTNRTTPVFMAHGEKDDIVLPALAMTARDILQNVGHDVTWKTYPVGHTISDDELHDLSLWLKNVLA
ncbi:putative carboxylesterase [Buttiauxella gaviniae ATCC 51604]|uniref:Putative carboxylesterase n=2 Tax=Buttiauxella gaviniae TaxID=82990 RepID=A0A1B7HM01_9ENTR|nr:dienelactone hydrolase family protein [Buttiauxella gaviniae]OAT16676.1 putative carboxylesterase [Buttiauxella gaviniae ATCC 51604]